MQVLKVAILAEKYAIDYTWYVDVILNLIRIAGDYVSEEVSMSHAILLIVFTDHFHNVLFLQCMCLLMQVWYRVIQIVTNRDDVQGYAAKTVFEVRNFT